MVDFIGGSITFITKYLVQIILVILIFTLMLVYMVVHDIQFKKKRTSLKRIVEIEGYSNASECNVDIPLDFCEKGYASKDAGQSNCGTLGKNACKMSRCCGWATYKSSDSKNKCIPITSNGDPKFKDCDIDQVYYNKK